MGLAALHIFTGRDYPAFFYGQNYMGTSEAYIGAVLFHALGASLLTLRIGLVLLYAIFLASTYTISSVLYTKRVGCVSVLFLGLGSSAMLFKQLEASGGYPEILALGSMSFLIAAWLSIHESTAENPRREVVRYAAFFSWGVAVGLGLWSDFLIIPVVAASAILLLACCRSELRGRCGVFAALGLVAGAFPLIKYNLSAAPGQDSLHVLLAQTSGHQALLEQVLGVFLVSFPNATGGATLCSIAPASVWPLSSHSSSQVYWCSLVHGGWTLGWASLWLLALADAALQVWSYARSSGVRRPSRDTRQHAARSAARLLMLGSAGLSVLLFVLNPAAATTPRQSARYLDGVLIATPCVVAMLAMHSGYLGNALLKVRIAVGILRSVALLVITAVLLAGTVNAFRLVPEAVRWTPLSRHGSGQI